MMKLFTTTALLAALAMPALAVQPAEGEKLAQNQTYTYWLLDAIKSLDPAKNTDVEGSDVLRSLFEGLMNEDAKGAMIPGVAESFEESDDKLTYTFRLRDAKWSNGDPVTAGDFVYAWRRVVDPETASEYAWFMELMNIVNATEIVKGEKSPEELGVKAIDDKTLEVTLTTPTPYFIKTLSHATTYPVPQKVIEAEGDSWTQPGKLVGNGAFVLESHNLGVDITLKKNPDYWDAENVLMETVKGVTVNDNNVALTRYQAGELDRVQIPAGQYPRLKQEYPDQATSIPYACSYAYIYNVSEKGPEALKDVRVRKALSLAINRDIIVDNVLQGGQRPATTWTHWAIEGFEQPETELATLSQQEKTAKAKELLAEAGYGPDNPLNLTLQYNTDESHKKLAIAVQQFWKPLGVNVTLNNVEWKVHTDRLQNQDFDVARYAWCGDYNEASTFLDWFRTDGYNSGKWSNAEYDKLMADSKTAEDTTPLYKRAEEILAEEVPAAFVYHYAKVDMISPRIKGLPTENVLNTWYAKDLYRLAD
ncbi:MAG: oligopeptide ABC transporter substrate-binding protein OppA [Paracoccus sp.]|jgi:oligopeptide transport system substrate-binding protein|uniref:peptide ABC transporter substrate-binding protein n=1 Tax=Paracoccus sp. TaxID=267 RepID=UPI000C5C0258|nr:oligopeptide ABC transporter substrate-binding protein OppA [Paracoccus sp. (in: a-proteobacteria)]MCS5603624.1 peptide ABC transporter substrate-binding protein [Paracoccus sp. (in: a-proteobacteria)]|tara:strand:- start:17521 stop:19122 length:1602 start_codon:yes stop_codon:yes gene_type:complete